MPSLVWSGECGNQHAVVLGAGVAGLLIAEAIAPAFERVSVLERRPAGRASPRDRHAHVLARPIREAVQRIAGLHDALLSVGAIHFSPDRATVVSGAQRGSLRPSGEDLDGAAPLAYDRAKLEAALVRVLAAHASVVVIHGIAGQLRFPAHNSARDPRPPLSVELRVLDANRSDRLLHDPDGRFDVIIDARGRPELLTEELQISGRSVPTLNDPRGRAALDYASMTVTVHPDDAADPRAYYVHTPDDPYERGVVALPIARDELQISIQARAWADLPRERGDLAGIARCCDTLGIPELGERCRRASAHSHLRRYSAEPSVALRVTTLADEVGCLLVAGDSLCRTSPRYGLGLSQAGLMAGELQDLFDEYAEAEPDERQGFIGHAQRRLDELADRAWRTVAARESLAEPLVDDLATPAPT